MPSGYGCRRSVCDRPRSRRGPGRREPRLTVAARLVGQGKYGPQKRGPKLIQSCSAVRAIGGCRGGGTQQWGKSCRASADGGHDVQEHPRCCPCGGKEGVGEADMVLRTYVKSLVGPVDRGTRVCVDEGAAKLRGSGRYAAGAGARPSSAAARAATTTLNLVDSLQDARSSTAFPHRRAAQLSDRTSLIQPAPAPQTLLHATQAAPEDFANT